MARKRYTTEEIIKHLRMLEIEQDHGGPPQFSMSIFEYEKLESDGDTSGLSGTYKDQVFLPYLGLWFYF